jgi:hypothetical protein
MTAEAVLGLLNLWQAWLGLFGLICCAVFGGGYVVRRIEAALTPRCPRCRKGMVRGLPELHLPAWVCADCWPNPYAPARRMEVP